MVDNSAIPVVFYTVIGDYEIRSPIRRIGWKDVTDINRRAAIIMASDFFYHRNFHRYRPKIPESCDKSFKDFLGYVATSLDEHLMEPEYLTKTRNTQNGFSKSLDLDCYIFDKEQAYNWMGEKSFKWEAFGCMRIVTSSPPISTVNVKYDFMITNVSTGRQRPQNLALGRQVVSKPHDSWAELIENVNNVHKKHGHVVRFQELIADKVILSSAGYHNISYLPHINEMLNHSILRNISI